MYLFVTLVDTKTSCIDAADLENSSALTVLGYHELVALKTGCCSGAAWSILIGDAKVSGICRCMGFS